MAGRTQKFWLALLGVVVAGAVTLSCQVEPGTATGGRSAVAHADWPALELVGGLAVRHPQGWHAQDTGRGNVTLTGSSAILSMTVEPHGSAVVAHQRLEEALTAHHGTRLDVGGATAVRYETQAPMPITSSKARARSFTYRPMVTYVTTLVARDDAVIRFDGAVVGDSGAGAGELDEVVQTLSTNGLAALTQPTSLSTAARSRGRVSIGLAAPAVAEDDGGEEDNDEFPPPSPDDLTPTPGTRAGSLVRTNSSAGVDSELEVAGSNDGKDIVIVSNSRDYSTSNDYGITFTRRFNNAGSGVDQGDPSIGVGASGTFYTGHIRQPDGSAAANNVTGCATEITASTDGGQTFTLQGYAFVSPVAGAGITFPDQPHIAVDRVNLSATNQDQIYSVWRDFSPSSPATSCGKIGSGFVSPGITCSTDGGATFTARVAIGNGDFPRVTVGQDGFVYATFLDSGGTNILLQKYSSCANGLVAQFAAPVTIAAVTPVDCTTLPGLDRCNDGNTLISPTIAVDGSNAAHVFAAYATSPATGREDVFIKDSTDGGATWTRPAVKLNTVAAGHRFMPWVCATGGTAFASWYDQRAGVGGASNDLADLFGSSASLAGGALVAGAEWRISQVSDPMCASGWPSLTRSSATSEACSVQPQLAGQCRDSNPATVDSNAACDFSSCPGASCPCLAGETCQGGGGAPKYGDYNGVACIGNRFYAAWASATSPPGTTPASTDIDIFFACPPNPDLSTPTFTDTTPPSFTSVPGPISLTTCGPATLGTPQAIDPCGNGPVTVTSDAPSSFGSGPTTVTWTATDAAGNKTPATQLVTVTDTTGPAFTVVPPDLTIATCTGVNIGSAFADDACGGAVTITNNAPARFPLGQTVVTWTARDAHGNTSTATQVITAILGDDASCCPAGTHVILGTPNNDTLTGTSGADCILGRGGQDTINGNAGNDFISGGDGNDNITGGAGNDVIYGGSGQDTLNGGDGDDNLFGGDGDDQLLGGTGNDVLHGGQGQDNLQGQDGNDTLFGDDGFDTLNGGAGSNVLAGGSANDNCAAGPIFEQCEFGAPNSCADGVKDGTETGLDCGGGCGACATGGMCVGSNDCLSGVCGAGFCQDVPSGIHVVPVVQTDWGGGYCVGLNVTNARAISTSSWTATVNLNQTTIFSSANATFSGAAGIVTVTPTFAADQAISPGATNGHVTFCANRNLANSANLPIVVGDTATF
ncbi:MAG: hypothetical protein ACJ8F1_14495 [Polyangia bacterium]